LNGTKLSPLQPDTGDVDNVVDSLMTNMKDHVAVDHNTISHTAKNGDADLSARSTPAASKREGSRTPEEFDISAMPSEADLVRVGQTAADSEDDEEAVGKEANEDDQKHNEAILEKVIRHPAQQPRPPTADMFSAFEDMFAPADDMFSATHITEHANPPALATTVAPLRHAIETTDDPEGYYQIIIGEVLDERYQVFTNLGRGVFSCVVRARDIKDPGTPDVAIKIIRNNDVMYKAGQKEYSILKRLQEADPEGKKHVVRMLSNFEHRKHLCIVFESMRYIKFCRCSFNFTF
jgi:serine/threonine-protein kinase PRP4